MTRLQEEARRNLAARGVKAPAPSQVVAEMKRIESATTGTVESLFGSFKGKTA